MCIVLSNVKPINSLALHINALNAEIADLRSDWELELMYQGDDVDKLRLLRAAEEYRDMLSDMRLALIRARDAARG
jgi:hypothetical protein